MPPESSRGNACSNPPSPTRFSASAARCSASPRRRLPDRARGARWSAHSPTDQRRFLKDESGLRLGRREAHRAAVRAINPAISLSAVDLPRPTGHQRQELAVGDVEIQSRQRLVPFSNRLETAERDRRNAYSCLSWPANAATQVMKDSTDHGFVQILPLDVALLDKIYLPLAFCISSSGSRGEIASWMSPTSRNRPTSSRHISS